MKFRVRKPGARKRLRHYKAVIAWREEQQYKSNWSPWFAWFPVRVPTKGRMSGMTLAWLEFIERKGVWYSWYSIECMSRSDAAN